MTASELPKTLPFRDGGVYTDPAGREVVCSLLPNIPTYLVTRAALAEPERVSFATTYAFRIVTAQGEDPIDPFTLRDTGKTEPGEDWAGKDGTVVQVAYERGPAIQGLYDEDES